MKSIKNKLVLSAAAALLVSTTAFADNSSEIAELKKQIQMLMQKTQELESKSIAQAKKSVALEEQSQMLIDETSDLKTGFNYTTVDTEKSFSGLGAAASKVYYSKSPLSIGGYGEMFYSYNSIDNTDNSSSVDIKRFITYIGYKFTDDIILNTEIEYESGGVSASGSGDKVAVEFFYLDFLMNKNANIRVGNFLMPVGLTNQRHEPTLFNTVQRPDTSYYLLPSTWTESGVMVYGNITDDLEYKVAAVTGLANTSGKDEKWIRKGRGGSFTNNNPDLGAVARLDYTGINGLLVGASLYYDSDINIWDTHIDYKAAGFRAYGVYTESSRDNSAANTAGTTEATDASGGYLNLSYDVLSLTSSKYQLPIFVQFESITPEDKRNDGTSAKSSDTTTVGVNFFPHEQVVLKLDYAMKKDNYKLSDSSGNRADADTISASVGFIF